MDARTSLCLALVVGTLTTLVLAHIMMVAIERAALVGLFIAVAVHLVSVRE